MKSLWHLFSASLLVLHLTGCTSESNGSPSTPTSLKSWYWQLQGTVDTNKPVSLYDIDLFDTPQSTLEQLHSRGVEVICYFSAGSWEDWRADADQYPSDAIGNPLDDWPGEKWVDIRNEQVRNILANRIALAKQKGCDGVEPDNVDGYSNNTGFPLTAEDQLNFNRFLAQTAHQQGLKIVLKNDMAQIEALVNDFDMALNEQCHIYQECDAYAPFLRQGKPVFNAEYDQSYRTNPQARDLLCTKARQQGISTLIANEALDGTEVYSCALNTHL